MTGKQDDSEQLQQQLNQRRSRGRVPQQIGDVVSRLLARRGYNQRVANGELADAWRQTVGDRLSVYCRIGNLRRGVLEVIVQNSAVVQELTFQKATLVKKMQAAIPEAKVSGLRFRVGTID